MHEAKSCKFIVKEGATGEPYLSIEFMDTAFESLDLPINFGVRFKNKAKLSEVEEIANLINRQLPHLYYDDLT